LSLAPSLRYSITKGIVKASLFNTTVTANSDILSGPIKTESPASILRIYCSFDSSGVISIVRKKGASTVIENLNEGASLAVNAAYVFDIIVEKGYSINIRYSVNATCLYLVIVEINSMV